VVGQDGLSDGTPIRILEGPGAERTAPRQARGGSGAEAGRPPQEGEGAPAAQARGGRPGWGGGPPPQMLDACTGKEKGADCSFTSPRSGDEMKGTCQPRRDDAEQLACRPAGRGGPGGGPPPGSGGGR